jgi:hypothetical protein
MILSEPSIQRKLNTQSLSADLVIVGGGLAGTCCAITAARAGIKVILVQDRPILGGNASSEVRLWVLGATSHLGNNNRWAREGGVINELLVETMYRNPQGNPLIFDTILLEKVINEPNITLLLNTAVFSVEKAGDDVDKIEKVRGFCSQNSTQYELQAPLFCDASGDGIVGFLAGAAFRMGAEAQEEFGEKFAPSKEYGELLGHSLYFYSKDTGKPVKFVAPSFAHDVTEKVPKFRSFNAQEFGCRLWWVEYGGRLDTVHDTESIKWELWRVIYGVWNYIKNSGQFPESENLTLEWVGHIPGKRESRRFEGDYMLTQQDIVAQREHDDVVAFGGWSIDLHPSDGVFSEKNISSCNQWHSKGIYGIPYRCYYSRNVKNLFLAGRIISASHVAFGSSRVMATSAHGAQAVGMAAVLCSQLSCMPRDLNSPPYIAQLQQALLKSGQHIPQRHLYDPQDLVHSARISTSSELALTELLPSGEPQLMTFALAQLIPLHFGQQAPPLQVVLHPVADEPTELEVELRVASSLKHHTPDTVLVKQTIALTEGRNCIPLSFDLSNHPALGIDGTGEAVAAYGFLTIQKNPAVKLQFSEQRITGLVSVFNAVNKAVSNYGKQTPPPDIGVEEFEFWCPQRRPAGQNLALRFQTPLQAFSAADIRNGLQRPTQKPNAWVADFGDPLPTLLLEWDEVQLIKKIVLCFDTDFDHPMETVLIHHPENVMPFCVPAYRILDDQKRVIYEKNDNHETINEVMLPQAITTRSICLELTAPSSNVPASLFEIRCYSESSQATRP